MHSINNQQSLLEKIMVFLLFGIGIANLQAQESINVAGGTASSSAGSITYSVGQAFCQMNTGQTGSIMEGVQQPYEVTVVTANEDAKNISLYMVAYPNPTTDKLHLKIGDDNLENINYQLFDMKGYLLQNGKVTSSQTSIDMNNLVAAIYFLKVRRGTQEIKVFKIIKK